MRKLFAAALERGNENTWASCLDLGFGHLPGALREKRESGLRKEHYTKNEAHGETQREKIRLLFECKGHGIGRNDASTSKRNMIEKSRAGCRIDTGLMAILMTASGPRQAASRPRRVTGPRLANERFSSVVEPTVWHAVAAALLLAATSQIFMMLDPLILRRLIDRYATQHARLDAQNSSPARQILLAAMAGGGLRFVAREGRSTSTWLHASRNVSQAGMYTDAIRHSLQFPYAVFEEHANWRDDVGPAEAPQRR